MIDGQQTKKLPPPSETIFETPHTSLSNSPKVAYRTVLVAFSLVSCGPVNGSKNQVLGIAGCPSYTVL